MIGAFKPLFDYVMSAATTAKNPKNLSNMLGMAIELFETPGNRFEESEAALTTALALAHRFRNEASCQKQIESLMGKTERYLTRQGRSYAGYITTSVMNYTRLVAMQASKLAKTDPKAAIALYEVQVERLRPTRSGHVRTLKFPVPVIGAEREFLPEFQTKQAGPYPLVHAVRGPYTCLSELMNTLADHISDTGDSAKASRLYLEAAEITQTRIEVYGNRIPGLDTNSDVHERLVQKLTPRQCKAA